VRQGAIATKFREAEGEHELKTKDKSHKTKVKSEKSIAWSQGAIATKFREAEDES